MTAAVDGRPRGRSCARRPRGLAAAGVPCAVGRRRRPRGARPRHRAAASSRPARAPARRTQAGGLRRAGRPRRRTRIPLQHLTGARTSVGSSLVVGPACSSRAPRPSWSSRRCSTRSSAWPRTASSGPSSSTSAPARGRSPRRSPSRRRSAQVARRRAVAGGLRLGRAQPAGSRRRPAARRRRRRLPRPRRAPSTSWSSNPPYVPADGRHPRPRGARARPGARPVGRWRRRARRHARRRSPAPPTCCAPAALLVVEHADVQGAAVVGAARRHRRVASRSPTTATSPGATASRTGRRDAGGSRREPLLRLRRSPTERDPRPRARPRPAARRGQLVVLPTDTVYGLGCDAFSARRVRCPARGQGPRARHAGAGPRRQPAHPRRPRRGAHPAGARPRRGVLARRAHPGLPAGALAGLGPRRHRRHRRRPDAAAPGRDRAAARGRADGGLLGEPVRAARRPRRSTRPSSSSATSSTVYLDGGPCASALPSSIVDVTGPVPVLLRAGVLDADDAPRRRPRPRGPDERRPARSSSCTSAPATSAAHRWPSCSCATGSTPRTAPLAGRRRARRGRDLRGARRASRSTVRRGVVLGELGVDASGAPGAGADQRGGRARRPRCSARRATTCARSSPGCRPPRTATFTLRQLAAVAAVADAAGLEPTDDPAVRLAALRDLAPHHPAPCRPREDDIDDPYGLPLDVYRATAPQIRSAVRSVVGAPTRCGLGSARRRVPRRAS